ncbi:MAG: CoA activase, partial [Deltaproteobacteria bacterium]|nr:CoA activase [Deltaproteobacteria bacterium]
MNARRARLVIGLDVGSIAVKAAVFERSSRQLLWRGYRRHDARPLEVAEQVLDGLCADFGVRPGCDELYLTGTGGIGISEALGVSFVHEVNAVSAAAQELYPDCRSLIDLGGQDAKVIFFREQGGERRRQATMNDKCAGGTGAVIEKLGAKLGFDSDGLRTVHHTG